MKDIKFSESDKKVYLTIDNETQTIPIYDINKKYSFIELNKLLDIVLNEDIIIDATIYTYDKDDMENNDIEIEKANIADFDGTVNITIYQDDNTIYYSDSIIFMQGRIQHTIPNTLPLGTYKITIDFTGNKYIQSTNLQTYLKINKRLGYFTFDKKQYQGYPNDNITITGKLRDTLNNNPLVNCLVEYQFNTNKYITASDEDGNIQFNIYIPDTDITHCTDHNETYDNIDISNNNIGTPYENEYEDTTIMTEHNTNITHNINFTNNTNIKINNDLSYILIVSIDNESYYIDSTFTTIQIKKLPTLINIQQDIVNNNISIYGNVIANYSSHDENVKYGNATLRFDDIDYSQTINIQEGVHFDIDLAEINSLYNNSSLDEHIPYQITQQPTSLAIKIENEKVSIGDKIIATVTLQSTILSEYIQGGMISFVLKSNNKEVYRYSTQTDSLGHAVFYFNTSHAETYQLYASYYGLCGYQDSQSAIKTIQVEGE